MFKNKSFNIKVVDDGYRPTNNVFVPRPSLDYDKINAMVKDQIVTVGVICCAVVATKQLSWSLGVSISNSIRQIVDVKFPYPPVKY